MATDKEKPQTQLPQPSPEGFRFIDENDTFSWGWFLFGALFLGIWNAIALTVFLTVFGSFLLAILQGGPVQLFSFLLPVLLCSLFVLVGLAGTAWGVRQLLIVFRLRPGELILPQHPLRQGESCRFGYQRTLRRTRTQQPGKVSGHLRCYEWVKYRAGTDVRTRTHDIWEIDFPSREVPVGTRRIEWGHHVTIPPEGPHSFEAEHNALRWELVVRLELPGIATDESEFRLWIEPEVVK